MTAVTRARRSRGAPTSLGSALLVVLAAAVPLAFLAVFFALPVQGMIVRGLRPDGAWDFSAIPEVLGRDRTARVAWFTVWMSALGTVVTVLAGLPVAYALYRLKFWGQGLLRAVVIMPFVLPTVVVGVMFRSLLAPSGPLGFLGWDGSWQAILAAFVFFNLAVVVRTVGGVWEGMDPRPAQAASALGANSWTVWRTVTLPALLPAIISAASVVFLFCATAFGVVLTLGGLRYGTIETEIYHLTTSYLDLRSAAVLSLLQLVAVAAMLGLAGWARARGEQAMRRAAVADRRGPTTADLPALGVTALVFAFILTPVVTLVARSFRYDGTWTLRHYRALAEPTASGRVSTDIASAMLNSLTTAFDATWMAVLLGLLVAFVVSRRPRSRAGRRGLTVLDAVFMLPLGISAVTVGFGFLITLDRPPLDLRSSPILVPIAQAMVALPLVVRTLLPVLRGIDDRARQAAATLGAAPTRVLATIDLPLVWRPLMASTGLAFAISLGEFGATSFLARPDRLTMPVMIYRLIARPGAENLGAALAASVVLAVVTVTVMGVVERLRVGSMGAF